MNNSVKKKIGNRINVFEALLSIPKTIIMNFKLLPFHQAIKFPIIISYHIKTIGINKKTFILSSNTLKFGDVRIGFGSSPYGGIRESKRGLIMCCNGGFIEISGKLGLSQGVVIVSDNSIIRFGNNFRCNYSTSISCVDSKILFGDDIVCGWNVTVKNGDGHTIIESGNKKKLSSNITIGDHVWLCSYCTILKGVKIGNNVIVAYNGLVTSGNGESNVMYAGIPAKIVKKDIDWEE